jgi:hypothetical protein
MKNTNIGFKAKEYLFYLNNANDENGIRPAEGWKFAKVDLEGRKAIEHAYYPAVATEIGEAEMENFTERVLSGIKLDHPKIHIADPKIENSVGAGHFIAFCADRPRR